MRQLPVELSSIGRWNASLADADNIKSAPIWQNSGSVMALIRCTLPALDPSPTPSFPTLATLPRSFSLRDSTVSSAVSTLHNHPLSFTTYLLSTYNSPRIVHLFPSTPFPLFPIFHPCLCEEIFLHRLSAPCACTFAATVSLRGSRFRLFNLAMYIMAV